MLVSGMNTLSQRLLIAAGRTENSRLKTWLLALANGQSASSDDNKPAPQATMVRPIRERNAKTHRRSQ